MFLIQTTKLARIKQQGVLDVSLLLLVGRFRQHGRQMQQMLQHILTLTQNDHLSLIMRGKETNIRIDKRYGFSV